jgi:hypothetical protein
MRIEIYIANISESEVLDHFEAAGFDSTAIPMTGSYMSTREPGILAIIYCTPAQVPTLLDWTSKLLFSKQEKTALIDTGSSVFLLWDNGSAEAIIDHDD